MLLGCVRVEVVGCRNCFLLIVVFGVFGYLKLRKYFLNCFLLGVFCSFVGLREFILLVVIYFMYFFMGNNLKG